MAEDRLIEVEYGPDANYEEPDPKPWVSHQWIRVSPRSCIPPSIFHICRETREEAKNIYKLTRFDSGTKNNKQRQAWYNKDTDIIYIGDRACISVIIRLLQKADYLHEKDSNFTIPESRSMSQANLLNAATERARTQMLS